MSSEESPGRHNEEFWRDFLSGGHSKERAGRRVFKLIPHAPAGLDAGLERRRLDLKVEDHGAEVVTLTVSPMMASGITTAPPSV